MENSKLKKIVIFVLVVAIFTMSFAYASLYQQLRINGNASVVASWKVEITGIKETNKVGNAYSVSIPTYTVSTATFNAQLQSSSDSIDYVVTIENNGKIDAKLNDIVTTVRGNNTIIYEVLGVSENDVLKAGEKVDVTVRVSLDPKVTNVTDTVNSDVMLIFNYIQYV